MKTAKFYLVNFLVFIFFQIFLFQICKANSNLTPYILNEDTDTIKVSELYKNGLKYFKNADYDSSLYFFEQAGKLYKETNNWIDYTKCLLKISNNLRIKGELNKALDQIQQIEKNKNINLINNKNLFAELLHIKGLICGNKGDYDDAINFLNKSIEYRIEANGENDTTLAKTYNNIGTFFFYKGKYYKALKYYQKALEISMLRKIKDNRAIATYYQNIGIIFAIKGDFDKANEYFNKNLNINRNILSNDDPNLGRIYLNLGSLNYLLQKFDNCINYLDSAENIYIQKFGKNYNSLGNIYLNKGNVYNDNTDYDKALMYYKNALNIFNLNLSPDHPDISIIYNNLGNVYNKKNNYNKALDYYKKSLSICKNPISRTIILRNFAKIYNELKQFNKAEKYYKLAIKTADNEIGKNHLELGHSYLAYGEFCVEKGDDTTALFLLKNAYNIYLENFGQKNPNVSNALTEIGNYYYYHKDFVKSIEYYQQAIISNVYDFNDINFYKNPNLENVILDIDLLYPLLGKAKAFYSLYSESPNNINDLKESLKCYDLAVKLIEKVRDYLSKESKYTLTENVKSTFDKTIKISLELYKTTKDKKYLETAFEYAEKSKSAVLLASIRDVDAIKFGDIPEILQDIEKEINGKIRAYDKLVYDEKNSENPDSLKINLWESKLFDLNREHDNLISKFEKEHKQYYSLKYDKNVISVKTIQKKLNKNKALIEYTVSDSLLFIFVITSEKFSALELPIDIMFHNNIELLRKLLKNVSAENSNVNFRDYSIVSYQLYRDLIKPIQNLITGKDLIIIPDGILGYIPFEALISMLPDVEKIDYRNLFYLIKNYSISYSYSATLLFKDYKTKTTGNKLLAFAPTYEITDKTEKNQLLVLNKPGYTLSPIKNAKTEIININKIFDGKYLQDLGATELNFKTYANNFDVLHFAMHTIINDENPMYSKMVFTLNNDSVEDGFLNTYEIYNLDLNARLVVLSACNTGFGKLNKGEGIMSLARGFLYAGVQSIIMTLWEIEDKSGAEIMTKFYNNLKEGNSIDNALRKAKLDYIKSALPLRAHPYFWAAYIDIGNTTTLYKSTIINTILLSILALIVIAILAVWFYRKKHMP